MPTQNWRSEPREINLCRDSKGQIVSIPADLELPGDRVRIRREGHRLIIEPLPRRKSLFAVLATIQPLGPEDEFPDVDRALQPSKAVEI
ncbi:AbrB/MazE/SpoVT family DNA-binding domain-containing protein [Falsigemmobacter faecalis]|uniref:AbrB/MazE/SpoVT family DNA-binding domain-containing protein n=1 Tax=Falsigemmobacter faecalis TaxID=2488730 RepID=A0A3P3DHP6_9RHOB|nr:AbrB/MazE/SpoVT family DNA-binding domain-containing protein [Falsigemmobacter faecalis]